MTPQKLKEVSCQCADESAKRGLKVFGITNKGINNMKIYCK